MVILESGSRRLNNNTLIWRIKNDFMDKPSDSILVTEGPLVINIRKRRAIF